jgi:ribosomal protein S18 acetylase RimI-like enzyme
MQINIINITKQKNKYKYLIENFLDSLDEEKKYFKLDRKRYNNFELTVVAIDNDRIAGLSALERKMIFVRSIITIHKEYQGESLGKRLYSQLIDEAKKTHNIILGITEENNYRASYLHYSIGFKKIGVKENLIYFSKPLNLKGFFIFHLIKKFFPVIKVLDRFRG